MVALRFGNAVLPSTVRLIDFLPPTLFKFIETFENEMQIKAIRDVNLAFYRTTFEPNLFASPQVTVALRLDYAELPTVIHHHWLSTVHPFQV